MRPVRQGPAIQVNLLHEPKFEVLFICLWEDPHVITPSPVIVGEHLVFLQGAGGNFNVKIVGLEEARGSRPLEAVRSCLGFIPEADQLVLPEGSQSLPRLHERMAVVATMRISDREAVRIALRWRLPASGTV